MTAAAGVTRTRRWPGRLAWALLGLAILELAVAVWVDQLLRQTGRPDLVFLTPSAFAPVLGAVSTAAVGRCWPVADLTIPWAGCCSPSASP